MKKSIISGVLALTVFFGVSQTIATPVAHAQNISIQQLIQLFISLGIIPSDKVAMVEAAFGMVNTTGITTTTPTTIPTTSTTVTTTQANTQTSTINGSEAVTPSSQTEQVGNGVQLNLTYPSNTVRSQVYLSCPSGVGVGASKGIVDIECNTYFDTTNTTVLMFALQNSTSQNQTVVPNYYIYTSDNPNYAKGVSASITVPPYQTTTTTTTTTNSSNPTITSSVQTASGNTALLTMTTPSNTVQAELYLSCPTGVSASNASGDTTQLCNTYKPMYFSLPSGNVANMNVFFTNTTSNTLTVAANFEVYTSDNPSYEKMVSTSINIPPSQTNITGLQTYQGSAFNFQYPQGWNISTDSSGNLSLSTGKASDGTITIKQISGTQVTDPNGHFPSVSYYYSNGQWMTTGTGETGITGVSDSTVPTVAQPLFTVGNTSMPVFVGSIPNYGWGQYNYVVAISSGLFLIVSGPDQMTNPNTSSVIVQIIKSIQRTA